MSFILSGFETEKAYEDHELSWDGERDFPDEPSAQQAAATWLASKGPEAQVEIIHLTGNQGEVIGIMTQQGIERVE